MPTSEIEGAHVTPLSGCERGGASTRLNGRTLGLRAGAVVAVVALSACGPMQETDPGDGAVMPLGGPPAISPTFESVVPGEPEDVVAEFNGLVLHGTRGEAVVSATVRLGGPEDLRVDGGLLMSDARAGEGFTLSLMLTSPSGVTGPPESWPGAVASELDNPVAWRIPSPETGTWIISLSSDMIASTDVDLYLRVRQDYPRNASPVVKVSAVADHRIVSFDIDGSYDVDGSITTVAWDVGRVGPNDAQVYGEGPAEDFWRASYEFDAPGTYEVTVIVTDDDGASTFRNVVVDVP